MIDSLDYYFIKPMMIPLISIARIYSVIISHCFFLQFWLLNYANSAFYYTNPFQTITYYHISNFFYFYSYHFNYSKHYHIFYRSQYLMYYTTIILTNYSLNYHIIINFILIILHIPHHPCILLHVTLSSSKTDSKTATYHAIFSKRIHFRWN